MLKLRFETGIGSVTGANFLLDFDGKKVLVDCGLIQGENETEKLNYNPFSYNPADIEILFITHAHLDHVGRIGKLVKDGFNGKIFSTLETKELAKLIMEDALKIMTEKAKKEEIEPIYHKQDIDKAHSLWQPLEYGRDYDFEKFSVFLKDAGHILGSCMYEFTHDKIKTVFTGDLGNSPSVLLRDTESVKGANYLIMESVYGDRNHEPKEERTKNFQDIVLSTLAKGGTVLIPAFSLERTQVILYELNTLSESGKLKGIPVFLDSPLATKVTGIYSQSTHLFNEKAKKQIDSGDDIFDFKKLSFVSTVEESKSLHEIQGPKIILAGSGMSMGGRVRRHESYYLPESKNTILLVGFQPLGTLGRRLQNKEREVNIDGQIVPIKARIETIFGYSSHKDSDHLVEFVATAEKTLKKTFVVMGEPKASMYLVQKLRDQIGVNAEYPEKDREYVLD